MGEKTQWSDSLGCWPEPEIRGTEAEREGGREWVVEYFGTRFLKSKVGGGQRNQKRHILFPNTILSGGLL